MYNILVKPFNKRFILDAFGYGFLLWLFGYILGFVFYAFVPANLLGWAIMPFGILVTLWVLFKKIHAKTFEYYLSIAIVWMVIAVVFDYFLLVQVLKPADGYYKQDVYIYYFLTLVMPLVVGYKKMQGKK